MTQLNDSNRIEDQCDICQQFFARALGQVAVCPVCGAENGRRDLPRNTRPAPETTMLSPAAEHAVKPSPRPRISKRGK